GQVRHVNVVRRGYVTRNLRLDGARTRIVVGLISESQASRGATAQDEQAADEAAERALLGGRSEARPPAAKSSAAAPKEEPKPPEPAAAPAKPEGAEPPAPVEKPEMPALPE